VGDSQDHLRVSHAEREDAIAILGKQLSEGRLTAEEYSQRSAAVAAALTRGDVRQLIADMRIGNEEREQAQAMLSDHFAAGRLTSDEFFARSAAISAAVTGDDLSPVFADLVNYSHDDRVRIGSAERDEAQEILSKQFAAGRLVADEFSARSAVIIAAITRADLRPVFADLPVGPPFLSRGASQ
jgi:uncharacterized membrane protein